MPDSIREKILASIELQMQNLTVGNGYELTVATTARGRKLFYDTELPAIGITDGDESSTNDYQDIRNTMTVNLDMHGNAGAVNLSVYANTLLANLKKAVFSQDTYHAGNAEKTDMQSASIRYPDDDNSDLVTATVTLSVQYLETRGDPYTLP